MIASSLTTQPTPGHVHMYTLPSVELSEDDTQRRATQWHLEFTVLDEFGNVVTLEFPAEDPS